MLRSRAMDLRRWGGLAGIVIITTLMMAYYILTGSTRSPPGLNLDRIQLLRYETVHTAFYDPLIGNITNTTTQGTTTLKVSISDRDYLVERVSDSLTPSGPNATFLVNNSGHVTDIQFIEGRSGNSTVRFSPVEGSSFDFPELIPLPEEGLVVPRRWSALIYLNYTIQTSDQESPGMGVFRQIGLSHYDLEVVRKTSITVPAGAFKAIEIRYNKTVKWTTWEGLSTSTRIRDLGGDEEEYVITGSLMIDPKTGVVLQNLWDLRINGSLGTHKGSTILLAVEPQGALQTLRGE